MTARMVITRSIKTIMMFLKNDEENARLTSLQLNLICAHAVTFTPMTFWQNATKILSFYFTLLSSKIQPLIHRNNNVLVKYFGGQSAVLTRSNKMIKMLL